ncbi:caveolin-3-like isoform X2 [Colias croceus]|uniref:caveolin-3-like isoform X2 n=1 Tax=Colias crocea TaxID=72248 RepID=UPI001E280E0F|nr:caveolin-3-like isoform X2 [Colias croceus]
MEVSKPNSGVREVLEDRDPNNLNQHIQIIWDDVIGEPEGVRSPERAWRISHFCFRHARNWCYIVLSVLVAPPCALVLGVGFACLAFEKTECLPFATTSKKWQDYWVSKEKEKKEKIVWYVGIVIKD